MLETQKKLMKLPKVFAVSGIKNSGKTTLITKLVTALTSMGYKVGVIKHDVHEFKADHEGTDSYKHKAAGAQNVILYDKTKFMMIKDVTYIDIYELIELQKDMDIIILEGMKYSSFPKIEIVRKAISQNFVCDPKTLLAIVTDVELQVNNVPIIDLDNLEATLDIVLKYINS